MIIPEYIVDIKNKSKKTIEFIEYIEKPKKIDVKVKDKNIKIKKKTYRKKKYFNKSK